MFLQPFLNWFRGMTPVVPKFYLDVESPEQLIKELCIRLNGLYEYSNKQTEAINDLADVVEKYQDTIDSTIPELTKRVEDLEKALNTIITSMLVYDPTKGKYTASIDQSRRMLQILGTPDDVNLTVQTLNDSKLTVQQWTKTYMCGEIINQSFKRMKNYKIPEQEVEV